MKCTRRRQKFCRAHQIHIILFFNRIFILRFNISSSRSNSRIKSQLSLNTNVCIRRCRHSNGSDHRLIIRSLGKIHCTCFVDTRRSSIRNSTFLFQFQNRIQNRCIFDHLASRKFSSLTTIDMCHNQVFIYRYSYWFSLRNRFTILNICHNEIVVNKLDKNLRRTNSYILHIRSIFCITAIQFNSCYDQKIYKVIRHIHISQYFSRYRINHEIFKLIHCCCKLIQSSSLTKISQKRNISRF